MPPPSVSRKSTPNVDIPEDEPAIVSVPLTVNVAPLSIVSEPPLGILLLPAIFWSPVVLITVESISKSIVPSVSS